MSNKYMKMCYQEKANENHSDIAPHHVRMTKTQHRERNKCRAGCREMKSPPHCWCSHVENSVESS